MTTMPQHQPDSQATPIVFDEALRRRADLAEFQARTNAETVREQAHELQRLNLYAHDLRTEASKLRAELQHTADLLRLMRVNQEHERTEGFAAGSESVLALVEQMLSGRDNNGAFHISRDVNPGNRRFTGSDIDLIGLLESDEGDTRLLMELIRQQLKRGGPFVTVCPRCISPTGECESCDICADCKPVGMRCDNADEPAHISASRWNA